MHSKVEKVLDLQTRLVDLEDPQVALHLLRCCLSDYVFWNCSTTCSCSEALELYDSALQHTLEQITQSSLDDDVACSPSCMSE